ncbi:hypothetical protein SK128_025975, partial [Halocaridina rubra]
SHSQKVTRDTDKARLWMSKRKSEVQEETRKRKIRKTQQKKPTAVKKVKRTVLGWRNYLRGKV